MVASTVPVTLPGEQRTRTGHFIFIGFGIREETSYSFGANPNLTSGLWAETNYFNGIANLFDSPTGDAKCQM